VEAADPLDPDTVHDRESFLAFVRALVVEREAAIGYGRQPGVAARKRASSLSRP
jgi:hypothetical protein